MSESKDHSSAGGKELIPSKLVSGIAYTGKKVAGSGGHVLSGIRSGTEKIASSGGKAISGIASSGGKAIHTITSPIGSAVQKTVETAKNSLHENSSHSTSSEKNQGGTEVDADSKSGDSAPEAIVEVDSAQAAPEEDLVASTPNAASVVMSDEPVSESRHSNRGLLGNVENVTNKILVNPVKGAAEMVAEGGNKLLVTPVKGATKKAKAMLHMDSKSVSKDLDEQEEIDEDLPDVPPDVALEKMNVIINKRLKDVSIPDYYAIAWSEGDKTDKAPLYGPWLKESGKQKIDVGEWEYADGETSFVGAWDGEEYTQRRVCRCLASWEVTTTCHVHSPIPLLQIVTFVFNKQIPFQMGPTLAKVKHTQYCRVEGKDKCVLAMTIEMQGVPYSDCFHVEIRWVATRSGKTDITIQVGLFVDFVKSTM